MRIWYPIVLLSSIHLRFALSFVSSHVTYSSTVSSRSLYTSVISCGDKERRYPKYRFITTARKMATMDSPSAQRNKEPIWKVLEPIFNDIILSKSKSATDGGSEVSVLEIAAGTGVHTEYFSLEALKLLKGKNIKLKWIATDPDKSCRLSIDHKLKKMIDVEQIVVPPASSLVLGENGPMEQTDSDCEWKRNKFDLIICINMIHISPWEATIGLMKTAECSLTQDGVLYCYGPYKEGGTAVESNLKFDCSLKERNLGWGVRDLEEVVKISKSCGLNLFQRVEMPANNLSLMYKKAHD